MPSNIQRSESSNLNSAVLMEIKTVENGYQFCDDEADILCDFDTLPTNNLSEISHLWRNAKTSSINKDNEVLSTAYDLRDNELESRQISLYEAISNLKVPEDLNLEAYNVNFFLATQAPIDISKSTIIKLDINRLKVAAETSSLVNEFIESIALSDSQNENHINAYHWDMTFSTSDQDKLVHIKSLLCRCSITFPQAKTMSQVDFSKQMDKIRKARRKGNTALTLTHQNPINNATQDSSHSLSSETPAQT